MKQEQTTSTTIQPDERAVTLAILDSTEEGEFIELPYEKLIIHDGVLMIPFKADGYVGFRPVPVRKAPPMLMWLGGKILVDEATEHHPNGLWPEVVSFFHYCNKTSDEGQVKLYYNPQTEDWLAWAPPQKGVGMTTKTDHEDPEYNKQREALPSGYQAWGSIHSHCNANAFQSSTDEGDERDQGGIHVTVGNLSSDELSIHGRLYMHKVLYQMHWHDWFSAEINTKPLDAVPNNLLQLLLKVKDIRLGLSKLRGDYLEHALKQNPGKDVEFPAIWKENFNKRSSSTVYSSQNNYGHGHGGRKLFESGHMMPPNDHWPEHGGVRPWIKNPETGNYEQQPQRPTRIEGFQPKEGGASNGATKSETDKTQMLDASKSDDDLLEEITLYERDYIVEILNMAEILSLHEVYVCNLAIEMANRDWSYGAKRQAYEAKGESFIGYMVKEATSRGINTFRACFLIRQCLTVHPCKLMLVEPSDTGGATMTPFDPTKAWEEFNKQQKSKTPAEKYAERYNEGD